MNFLNFGLCFYAFLISLAKIKNMVYKFDPNLIKAKRKQQKNHSKKPLKS